MYNKIKSFCEEKKITISQMCKNLNIPQQCITNLKIRTESNSSARLSAENTAKIADFMGISVTELLKSEEE